MCICISMKENHCFNLCTVARNLDVFINRYFLSFVNIIRCWAISGQRSYFLIYWNKCCSIKKEKYNYSLFDSICLLLYMHIGIYMTILTMTVQLLMGLYDCSHLEEFLVWTFTLQICIADFICVSALQCLWEGRHVLQHTFLHRSPKRSSSQQSRENGMELK